MYICKYIYIHICIFILTTLDAENLACLLKLALMEFLQNDTLIKLILHIDIHIYIYIDIY